MSFEEVFAFRTNEPKLGVTYFSKLHMNRKSNLESWASWFSLTISSRVAVDRVVFMNKQKLGGDQRCCMGGWAANVRKFLRLLLI